MRPGQPRHAVSVPSGPGRLIPIRATGGGPCRTRPVRTPRCPHPPRSARARLLGVEIGGEGLLDLIGSGRLPGVDRLAYAGGQGRPGRHQTGERGQVRSRQGQRRLDQVGLDCARPRLARQFLGVRGRQPCSLDGELGEEVLEVAEVVVQQAGGATGFASDRPPSEAAGPFAYQDALRGLEELLPKTRDRDSAGRHESPI